jgi:hypothetical protein
MEQIINEMKLFFAMAKRRTMVPPSNPIKMIAKRMFTMRSRVFIATPLLTA